MEDPSGALRSWNETNPLCRWKGVRCDNAGSSRVVALNLSSLGISGMVSPSIGNLTFLEELVLSENVLSGEIPPELGSLSRLKVLDLNTNSLQGEIPDALTNCTGLVILNLVGNRLAGAIPPSIGSLSKLHVLYLAKNSLAGAIPPAITNLTDLGMLALLGNHIVGAIPEGIGRLKLLEVLQLSDNNLSGDIPAGLFNLSSLWFFAAATNQLSGRLPPDIGVALPNLMMVYLGGNLIAGGIPPSLSNATGLMYISIGYNLLRGPVPSDLGRLQALTELNLMANEHDNGGGDWAFVDSMANCTELQVLNLIGNNLVGALPESISRLSPRLEELGFSYNNISGEIPRGIKNLTSLIYIELNDCLLAGEIPEEITELKMLLMLYLHNNRLSGKLPEHLGNMTILADLSVASNRLEGPIPPGIGELRHLMNLFLVGNNLNGTIPGEIFRPSSLMEIDIGYNLLTGHIPPEIGGLKNLIFFGARSNDLSGEIPDQIGGCVVLEHLYLQENKLAGGIPPSMNDLKGLIEVNLSSNTLTGSIGIAALENLPFLTSLDISFNLLEGEVPTKGVYRNASAVSLAGNEGLCGGVPELNLPLCPAPPPSPAKKRGLQPSYKIVFSLLGSVVAAAAMFASAAAFLRAEKRRRFAGSGKQQQQQLPCYPMISYAELHRATNGFSGDNVVGAGAHGSVYMGERRGSDAAVAIKVFDLRMRRASKSCVAEQEALRTARHRNIVKILAACSDVDQEGNGFRALVYEFMPNGSLEQWLHAGEEEEDWRRRSLDLFARLSIAANVAEALHYLHDGCRTPIAHCDVKPSNVLLDADMAARLTDFGLARFVHEHPGSSSTIGLRGSVGYIAPEFGSGGRPSTHSDVYSYGILLLEMFTGRRPVDDMFRDSLDLRRHVENALPDRVLEIVDPRILTKESGRDDAVLGSLVSVLQVGLSCSKQHPYDRIRMRDAATRMSLILKTHIHHRGHGEVLKSIGNGI